MADVVIVGAGPVGLWVATQIKMRDPDLDVQVYEKHKEYQRSHILQLEYRSLLLYAKHDRSRQNRDFLETVTGVRSVMKVTQESAIGESTFLRTNDLEAALKIFAKAVGVDITYDKVETPEQVESLHPKCKFFIAADGSQSAMRKALMKKGSTKEYPLQYVVEVKLELAGDVKKMGLSNAHKLNQKTSNTLFEFVGRSKEEVTPVTLRLFVDKKTYDAIPEATFKNPLTLDNEDIPDKISGDVKRYMAFRNVASASPGKLTKLVLSLYRAKRFATMHGNRAWFLAGDAAMGIPYFRSLNAGMVIGSQLGFIITRPFVPREIKVGMYNAAQPLDVAWEFTGAYSKDLAIKTYDAIRKLV